MLEALPNLMNELLQDYPETQKVRHAVNVACDYRIV